MSTSTSNKPPRVPPALDIRSAASEGGLMRPQSISMGGGESLLGSIIGSPRLNSTGGAGIPSPKLGSGTPGSPRTPSSRFEDPMMAWRKPSPSTLNVCSDGGGVCPSPGHAPSPSSPSFRGSPVGSGASFSRAKTGVRDSLSSTSFLLSRNMSGTEGILASACSSRRQSQSGGLALVGADAAAPWVVEDDSSSNSGDEDEGGEGDRPSGSNPSDSATTTASAHLRGGTSSLSSGLLPEMADLQSMRRHSLQPSAVSPFAGAPSTSALLAGRTAMSMRVSEEDDFMKRLQSHRASWRVGASKAAAGAAGAGEGLQNKTHEALQQLMGEMKAASFKDGSSRRVSSNGGSQSLLIEALRAGGLGAGAGGGGGGSAGGSMSTPPAYADAKSTGGSAGGGRYSMDMGSAERAGGMLPSRLSVSYADDGPDSSSRKPPLAPRPQALHTSCDL